jgi:hypothetical protein
MFKVVYIIIKSSSKYDYRALLKLSCIYVQVWVKDSESLLLKGYGPNNIKLC